MMLSVSDRLSFGGNFDSGFGNNKRRRKSFELRSILNLPKKRLGSVYVQTQKQ